MNHRGNAFAGMAVGVIGTAVLAVAPVGAPSAIAAPSSSSVTLTCAGSVSSTWSTNRALSQLIYTVVDDSHPVNVFDFVTVTAPSGGSDSETVMNVPVTAHQYTTTVRFYDPKLHVIKSLTATQTVTC